MRGASLHRLANDSIQHLGARLSVRRTLEHRAETDSAHAYLDGLRLKGALSKLLVGEAEELCDLCGHSIEENKGKKIGVGTGGIRE